jgi:type VI secretion system protein VasJ
MAEAFADWVEKGYRSIAAKRGSVGDMLFWRFWVKGARKDALSCGILRDSVDSIGRPYPFMIIGSGTLKDWESEWNNVLWACEKPWNQMESIAARKYRDLAGLEDDVRRLKGPDPDWPEYRRINRELDLIGNPTAQPEESTRSLEEVRSVEEKVMDLADGNEILVPVEENPALDRFTAIHLWQSLLKLHLKEAPNIVFMGGNSSRTYLGVFRKALAVQDFINLWSVT